MSDPGRGQSITRVTADDRAWRMDVADIISFREVLYFLVWRDIKVRYQQTKLGIYWVILQPLVMMVIYSAVFGSFVRSPSSQYPYALFVLVGLLPWTFFSNAVSDLGNCLLQNSQLIGKVYFPRIYIPAARIITLTLDFSVMSVLLLVLILVFRVPLTWSLLLFPVLALLTIFVAFGVGSLLAALNVRFRDIQFVIPFSVQVWLFCTPVIYPSSAVPDRVRWIIALNPLTGLVETYRVALLGAAPQSLLFLYSAVSSIILLVVGLGYFNRVERNFADII